MTREIDAALAERLERETTTLCRCWRVRRRDGVELGFTDHDRALRFGGLDHEPETGFRGSEIEAALGLSVDNLEAAGALSSARIDEADVIAGRWDGAEVEQWLVDWTRPERRLKVFAGRIGEIRRGGAAFEMEVLGLAEALNRPRGRVYQRLCDAEVGDVRCAVALNGDFRRSGEVAAVLDARRFEVTGLEDRPEGWFADGRLEWISGANAGATAQVAVHRAGAAAVLELRRAPEAAAAVGDGLRVFAGCDKTAETCRAKFGNLANHRGFPFMPGEDWITSWPREDEAHDGGSLFR